MTSTDWGTLAAAVVAFLYALSANLNAHRARTTASTTAAQLLDHLKAQQGQSQVAQAENPDAQV